MILCAKPNAKINIGLSIKGKRPDGYHLLETLFFPVSTLYDELSIELLDTTEAPTLDVTGITLAGSVEQNLCMRAWYLLKAAYPDKIKAVHIKLHKNIPPGAGLGGGSSDAAATLSLLNQMFSVGLSTGQLQQYARQLGADVPFFIETQPCLAKGIGDEFLPLDFELPNFEIKVVLSDIFCDTTWAYRSLKPEHWSSDLDLFNQLRILHISLWKNYITNDFENIIFLEYPTLIKVKEKLYNDGAIYASMSGSGSAMYGLFLT